MSHILSALGLLEKAETTAVEITFTTDYSQVCLTTNRVHVLARVKIVNRDIKIPGTDKLMFRYNGDKDGDSDGGRGVEQDSTQENWTYVCLCICGWERSHWRYLGLTS